ncbi:hypothetical protein [Methylotenera versatilis]|uniref:hypothetical protein n=1 Tax=Methylotenera versatilis TaxID=1055487 RepID=UPI0006460E6D|nr:hypothetical protein [Methylotenera versatilis]
MNNVKSLKARQLNAVKLLSLGTPAYLVAAQLEVSTMTVYRWQKLPEFEAKLNSITTSGLEEIAKQMNATTLTAVQTLQEILCDMRLPSNTRLKAALGVLSTTASVNSMLEKSLIHRMADFDLKNQFKNQSISFDSNGNKIEISKNILLSKAEEIEI